MRTRPITPRTSEYAPGKFIVAHSSEPLLSLSVTFGALINISSAYPFSPILNQTFHSLYGLELCWRQLR